MQRAGAMMRALILEVRDSGTFIPALAVELKADDEAARYLLARVGYRTGGPYVMLWRVIGGRATTDHFDWDGSRTMTVAHRYILENWASLKSGDVIDVEHIIGLTPTPKKPESEEMYE